MSKQNKNQGCGCANIPISVMLLFLGGGFWWFKKNGLPDINIDRVNDLLAKIPGIEMQIPVNEPAPPPNLPTPTPTLPAVSITTSPELPPTPESPLEDRVEPLPKTDWEQKKIRGIYLSRYQITNNASEQMIRDPKATRSVIAFVTIKLKDLIP